MTQPVTRNEWFVDLGGPPPPPALPVQPPVNLDSLPDPVDHSLVRLSPSPSVGAAPPDATAVGIGLDAFLSRATPTFRTPAGWVAVPIGFQMNYGDPFPAIPPRVLAKAGNPADVSLVQYGRATPETIAKVTQAFIDLGYLPASAGASTDPASRIRQLMYDWRLGLDCAGYTALAILSARSITRAEAGFTHPGFETLSTLGALGYTKVSPGAPLKAGDVFVLHAQGDEHFEHRAIVREARPATAAETASLVSAWSKLPGAAKASDQWTKVVVDSSWGNGTSALAGGAQRRTWWHDATTGLWAWTSGAAPAIATGPCNHPSFEVMRHRGPR